LFEKTLVSVALAGAGVGGGERESDVTGKLERFR
jgi:hypothetical protein